jgi:hypothetical protein
MTICNECWSYYDYLGCYACEDIPCANCGKVAIGDFGDSKTHDHYAYCTADCKMTLVKKVVNIWKALDDEETARCGVSLFSVFFSLYFETHAEEDSVV